MSIKKLVSLPDQSPNAVHIRKLHGGDREWPKNFRPYIQTDNSRLGLLSSYGPIGWEYRQLSNYDTEKGEELRRRGVYDHRQAKVDPSLPLYFHGHLIFFHDGTGIAYGFTGSEDKPDHSWFEFGCNHKMEHTTRLGNCYNRYTCSKCGYVDDVDSSD
jgi:hypothetical protein